MPSSQVSQIPKIIKLVMELNPQSICDLGAGFGKYGVLCREYLELWDGRYEYTFKRKIDAVEIFKPFITPLHRYIYNNIFTDDVFTILDSLVGYDLILIIGTLEHFEKQKGKNLLSTLLQKNKNILVSTPNKWQPQQAGFNNPYEVHKTFWTKDELTPIGKCKFIDDENSIICLLD